MRTSQPSTSTASSIGLGNVTNTSDANKPVSAAQQTALNLKADSTSVGVKVTADTGWTAPTSGGDKTAQVTDYTNGLNGTMVTALNVVSAGTGTALSAALDMIVVLRKIVQALETALAANKLPNI